MHLSLFYDEKRETDLLRFCQENLEIIKPEVVLVTGDITDAKFADKEGSMQFVNEWKQYDRILRESEVLEKTVWLDTRGNHDAFDVPSLTSNKNYFRMFSAKGKQHLLSYRYHHRTSDGDSFSFISIDACPNPGPKRPFNFFGLVGESEFNNLKNLVEESVDSNHTIFFGHYPTSTIGSPHPGIRQLLSHGAVYLCGHLHTMAGMVPNMYALQQLGYLELELADWKDSRFYRLFAVDHDIISLVDMNFEQWPVILVTNPKNALFHVPDQEPTQRIGRSTHIRLLIFSKGPIEGVSVEVDGVSVGRVKHVGGPLYVVPWQPMLYAQGLHVIRVSAEDSLGFQNEVSHYFSVDGSRPSFRFTSRFFLMSDHTKLFRTTFAIFYGFAVLPLLIAKVFQIRVQAVFSSRMTGCLLRFLLSWIRRFCLIGSAPKVFYPLLMYNICLAVGPWFIGEILEGEIGFCFLFGIFVMGEYIPGTLTYLYGTLQLIMFNIPLTLYLGRCLDLSLSASKQVRPSCPSRLWPLTWLLDHGCFVLIVLLQFYLAISGFYRAYGLLALVLCPMRTWAVVLAFYLRKQALHKVQGGCIGSSSGTELAQKQQSPAQTSSQMSCDGAE